jgi:hypothetical protein
MLGLLLVPSNRTARAWWIWLPLLLVAASESAARTLLGFIPSQVLDIFCQVFSSLGLGVAAVWLLATHLEHRLRFLAFLKMLGAVLALSAFSYLVQMDWQQPEMGFGFLVCLGVCALVAVTGLSLAGLVSRRQYWPVGLTLWLAVFISALWLVISAPFYLMALISSGGRAAWLEFAQIILAFAALTFGMVLPFLVLAFANGLFRERLKNLLHLRPTTPPPVPVAPPPVLAAPAVPANP